MDIKENIILITLIYVILLIITAFNEFVRIRKNNKLLSISFFNLYYIIVYFITPICYLMNFQNNLNMRPYTNEAIYYYKAILLQVIGYIMINFSYWLISKIKRKNDAKNQSNNMPKNLEISTFILLLIGWYALIIWTKAYGSVIGIFKYASQIRSGIIQIYNPYTFVKPFCAIIVFSMYVFFVLLLNSKKKTSTYKLIISLGFIASVVGSFIYSIANDGRMLMLIMIIVLLLYYFTKKNTIITKKDIIKYGILGITVLIILGNLDYVTYYIRNGKSLNKRETTLSLTVANEFGFTYNNVINILYNKDNNKIKGYTEIMDLKNILLSWVPERFKLGKVINLYEHNTKFYDNITWQIPTDLITASIYKFGYFGVILLPMFVGFIVMILDWLFNKETSEYNNIVYYLLCTYVGLRSIAYYDLSQILFGCFYIIVSLIIVGIISKFTGEKKI